ncbi:MAG: NfeD family protein [Bacteroidota bacterium]
MYLIAGASRRFASTPVLGGLLFVPRRAAVDFITPLLFVLVGLALITAEVYFIPGLNVVGVAGVLSLMLGVGYAFMVHGVVGGAVTLAGAVVLGGVLGVALVRSGAWNRFILQSDLKTSSSDRLLEEETRARYLGRSGTAVSPLRPTGVAEIDGERVEVQTEGEFIAAGSRIRIVAMDRRRYFARLDKGEA